jgi:Domain of unknown function (DUF1707)
MLEHVNPGDLRAGDADRERVAERLRTALDEGRLNLYEYDDRLREAYAAKTYGELDALLEDLPGVTPASQSQVATRANTRPGGAEPIQGEIIPADGHYPGATGQWIAEVWGSWARAVAICVLIWGAISLLSTELTYFWPGWVAGPWGAVLLVQTVAGLSQGEPQRWAARRARRRAEKNVRRRAREDSEHDDRSDRSD